MLLTTLALAASLQFDCPPSIEDRQQLLTPQKGWQTVIRNTIGEQSEPLSHPLDHLALFDGDPDGQAQLKPDNGDSDEVHYWSLLDSSLRPLFLVCHYQNSAITLQQALPRGISYCRVNQSDRYTLHGLICRK
ncbi:STY0301 family protein [Aeromonas finlandensis]|uniref:STY0301 family protein n=1 Tax=Aeromonas finlandensis TaxID=1543375 RepID=UPI00051C3265|nr:STY0301 family protein [Aeromonas finlandensis]